MPLFGDKKKDQLTELANRVLADALLSAEEERAFFQRAAAMGVPDLQRYPEILSRLVIARVNDGRMPVILNPQLMTKSGEVVHLETVASMMKEVTIREWQSRGFSFVSLRA
jgi:hypothetical protein